MNTKHLVLLLVAVGGGYVLYRWAKNNGQPLGGGVSGASTNAPGAPAQATPQTIQQIYASLPTAPDQATQAGVAPANAQYDPAIFDDRMWEEGKWSEWYGHVDGNPLITDTFRNGVIVN